MFISNCSILYTVTCISYNNVTNTWINVDEKLHEFIADLYVSEVHPFCWAQNSDLINVQNRDVK